MPERTRGGWRHDNANWKDKICPVCNSAFKPKSGVHKFCSAPCKGKWKYISGSSNTDVQYEKISGNWNRYLSRLLYVSGRKRDNLSVSDLLLVLERQNYKCALSGVDLTCNLQKGIRFRTNCSVDRINAGGPYSIDNIQLVCQSLNYWRSDMPVTEFVDWCRKVVDNADRERKVTDGC